MTTNSRQLSSLIERIFFLRDMYVHSTSTLVSGTRLNLKYELESCRLQVHLSPWLLCQAVASWEHSSRVLKQESPSRNVLPLVFWVEVGKDQPPQPVVSLRSPEAALSHSPSWRSTLDASADVVKIVPGIFGLLWNVWFQHTFDFCWIHERLKVN